MSVRLLRRRTAAAATLLAAAVVALPLVSAPAEAVVLPTPKAFVSNLDLECFRTPAYTPPTTQVRTRHLNPVLTGIPIETVTLGPRQQLCVPVAKNGVIPPSPALDFLRYVDLACYRITGASLNRTLTLSHLNPQLASLPRRTVTLTSPQQLCVPVLKRGTNPPADVVRLVSYIDLKCYLESPQTALGVGLGLSHLNPLFATGLAAHQGQVTFNRQLCVPVGKNSEVIPADVLNIVRWVDLEKFDLVTPALATPRNVTLAHLNPSLAGLPVEELTIQVANSIMLPVAKNGAVPPG
jgi:hypothetical protein